MRLDQIMVKELREEHHDREWVDRHGYHWIWCETEWMVNDGGGWCPAHHWHWYSGDEFPTFAYRGPFIEGLYYAATRRR